MEQNLIAIAKSLQTNLLMVEKALASIQKPKKAPIRDGDYGYKGTKDVKRLFLCWPDAGEVVAVDKFGFIVSSEKADPNAYTITGNIFKDGWEK